MHDNGNDNHQVDEERAEESMTQRGWQGLARSMGSRGNFVSIVHCIVCVVVVVVVGDDDNDDDGDDDDDDW